MLLFSFIHFFFTSFFICFSFVLSVYLCSSLLLYTAFSFFLDSIPFFSSWFLLFILFFRFVSYYFMFLSHHHCLFIFFIPPIASARLYLFLFLFFFSCYFWVLLYKHTNLNSIHWLFICILSPILFNHLFSHTKDWSYNIHFFSLHFPNRVYVFQF